MQFALKIDKKRDVKTVRQEARVLENLKSCRQVVRVHDTGSFEGRSYFVMDLLGHNLVELRRNAFPEGRMSVEVAKAVATSTLLALESLHAEGYVHRDIKPANFVIQLDYNSIQEGVWNLIDFGLARRFCDEANVPLPERADASFRGSTTYASVHSHDSRDLGRRDDLWSWFYMVVELLEGTLPWRVDRDAISPNETALSEAKVVAAERKRECTQSPDLMFASGSCPKPLRDINNYLVRLEFTDKPKYSYLQRKLNEMLSENGQCAKAAAAPTVLPATLAATDVTTRVTESLAADVTDNKGGAPMAIYESHEHRSRSRTRSPERRKRSPSHVSRSSDRCRRRFSSRSRSLSRSKSRSSSPRRRRDKANKKSTRHRKEHDSVRDATNGLPAISAAHERNHTEVLEFVAMLRAGGISQEGATALHHLRRVQPAEAVGLSCWVLDELITGLEGEELKLLAPILEELAGFASVAAARCTIDKKQTVAATDDNN
jgi:serine/threonine protein kinase